MNSLPPVLKTDAQPLGPEPQPRPFLGTLDNSKKQEFRRFMSLDLSTNNQGGFRQQHLGGVIPKIESSEGNELSS